MDQETKARIKGLIESEFDVNTLDDMAAMFFKIARAIGHPLSDISLELTETWGEQLRKYEQ